MTVLGAGRFVLRPFVATDAAEFAAAVRESMSSVGVWMSWAHAAFSDADALTWFASCDAGRAAGTAHEFAIVDAAGRFVGGAGLNQLNPVNGLCNLGYWVRASAQRQGAARAAVAALAEYGFGTLAHTRIEIVVADGNAASIALARAAGATHECVACNRLRLHGTGVAAHVFSLIPADTSSTAPNAL